MRSRRPILLCAAAAIAAGALVSSQARGGTAADTPTVETLLEAVRHAVRPAESMRVEWTYEVPAAFDMPLLGKQVFPLGPPHVTRSFTAIVKGRRSRIESVQKTYESVSSEQPYDEYRATHVYDGKSLRFLVNHVTGGSNTLQGQQEEDGVDKNSEKLTRLCLGWRLDLTNEDLVRQCSLRLLDSDQSGLYVLEVVDNQDRLLHYTIDGNRGYNVVKVEVFQEESDKDLEVNVELRQYEGGIWFVAGYEQIRYPPSQAVLERRGIPAPDIERPPLFEGRGRVTSVEFGVEVPDETFVLEFPERTQPWEGPVRDFSVQEASLLGERLGDLAEFGLDTSGLEGRKVLVCFFDMEQRPSRQYVVELGKRFEDLGNQGVAAVAVHASPVEDVVLKDWLAANRVSLPVGVTEKGLDSLRSEWATRSLPWLILADWKHIVRAEGFGIDELTLKISEVAQLDAIEGHVIDPNGEPLAGALVRINRDVDYYCPPEVAETDEQGYYCLEAPEWPYRIMTQWQESFSSGQRSRRQSLKLDRVFEGPHTIDFQYPAFPGDNTILNGRALDSEGSPVRQFKVWVIENDYRQRPGNPYRCQVDCTQEFVSEDGSFELSGLPAGDYTVTVMPQSRRYESGGTSITLAADATGDCVVRLKTRKTFYGRVVFEDGSPALLADAKTQIAMRMGDGSSFATLAYPDAEGIFEIHVSDDEIRQIESQGGQLWILLKGYFRGTLSLDQLTNRREDASTVTLVRPEPPAGTAGSLVGKPLPSLGEIGIDSAAEQIEGKRVLVCFFALDQRPSRNCVLELNRRAQELSERGVAVIVAQTASAHEAALETWVNENDISFPVGTIEAHAEQLRMERAVESLPWMILTDRNHVVRFEGLALGELDQAIGQLSD